MDNRILTILQDCPILPRSEIYYFFKDADRFIYKQGTRRNTFFFIELILCWIWLQ